MVLLAMAGATRATPQAKPGRALKSIFATLRSHKAIFASPAARVRVGHFGRRIPLPANHDDLAAEVRDLKLTGIRDGRCILPDRTVLLAGLVRTRLAAY